MSSWKRSAEEGRDDISSQTKGGVERDLKIGVMLLLASILALSSQAPVVVSSASFTVGAWEKLMQTIQTPVHGCFTAIYPHQAWIQKPCFLSGSKVLMAGGSLQDVQGFAPAQYSITSATGGWTAESNYQSEYDSNTLANNDYTLQLDSDFYTINWNGVQTTGWTQFVMQNTGVVPSGSARIFIEWWLIGYAVNGRSCPTGWISAPNNDCALNSVSYTETAESAAFISAMTLGGSASANQDTTTYCFQGRCDSVSASDTVFLSQGTNWHGVEYNVLGFGGGSTAIFNAGFALDASVSVNHTGSSSISCGANSSWTAESNNMQLLPCNIPNSTTYTFHEYVSSGGGGGSVAPGSMITLSDGSKVPVQNLQVGGQLLSYDLTNNQYVATTITRLVTVETFNMMVISTSTGKPLTVDQNPAQKLFVKTPDGTVTLMSVTGLKVGYDLFDAQSWVPIVSIHYENSGTHLMYDIYDTAPSNYFANGYLVQDK